MLPNEKANTDWKKYLQNVYLIKIIFRMFKELSYKSIRRKQKEPDFKNEQIEISLKHIQMANKDVKICSISLLVNWEVQIKITRYHLPTGRAEDWQY